MSLGRGKSERGRLGSRTRLASCSGPPRAPPLGIPEVKLIHSRFFGSATKWRFCEAQPLKISGFFFLFSKLSYILFFDTLRIFRKHSLVLSSAKWLFEYSLLRLETQTKLVGLFVQFGNFEVSTSYSFPTFNLPEVYI